MRKADDTQGDVVDGKPVDPHVAVGLNPYIVRRGIRHHRAPRKSDLELAKRLGAALQADGRRLLATSSEPTKEPE